MITLSGFHYFFSFRYLDLTFELKTGIHKNTVHPTGVKLKDHSQFVDVVVVAVVDVVVVVVAGHHLHVPDDATLWHCKKNTCDVTHKFGSTGWCRVSRIMSSHFYFEIINKNC